jgi:serine/threonine-protein kinase
VVDRRDGRCTPKPARLRYAKSVGPLAQGALIAGKYRIERTIGEGGTAVVYAAYHQILAQRVALKLIRKDDKGELGARFVKEARAATRLQGEHFVRVHDVGILDDGTPYIAMELLSGKDLSHLLREHGAFPVALAVDCVLQALEAVGTAHAHGIVHRDLKPANLFLSDGHTIKVLDFGISKATDPFAEPAMANTSTSAILGTPAYMSPEQLRSAKDVDAQADVWSLGVILYELCAGRAPFAGETVGAVFSAILERTPPLLHLVRPDVPRGLSEVVARCIEKEKSRRFSTVGELARALSPYAERAEPAPPWRQSGETAPPRRQSGEISTAQSGAIQQTAGSWAATTGARPRRTPRALFLVPTILVLALVGLAIGYGPRRKATATGATAPPLSTPAPSAIAAPAPEPPAGAVAIPPPTSSYTPAPLASTPEPSDSARPTLQRLARPRPAAPLKSAAPSAGDKPRADGLTSDRHW